MSTGTLLAEDLMIQNVKAGVVLLGESLET